MRHFNYLIVGGGMAARAAAAGIRQADTGGSIGILAAEQEPPYDRPPLSKKLWTGGKKLENIYGDLPEGVDLLLGRRVRQLVPQQQTVRDEDGHEYQYEKLLLATGSTPRRLPFGGDRIIYYRTVNDYHRLRKLAESQERFAVIGGGFIGTEIAAVLAMQGRQVTMIFPEQGIGRAVFPPELSGFLNGYYREKGVEVLSGTAVTDVTGEGTDLEVLLDDGRRLAVNGVVAGIGVLPNVGLAEAAGLAVRNGIEVDSELRTSDPQIFAAGDVANYPDGLLEKRRRVEHEDAALTMGRTAGRNMAGSGEKYNYSPMFYSDLFDLGYEAVGELDSRLEMVIDWRVPCRKGVVYYVDGDRVRGVLLWDTWDQVDAARQLISRPAPTDREQLIGRLPA